MISVAVPRLEKAFGLEFAQVSWAIIVFYLVSAVAQPVMGRLSDRVGRKRLFLTGLVTALAASVLAACSTVFGWLLVFRGLQALGTSMVASVGLSIIRLTVTEGRARAVATVSIFLSAAAAFGPAVGGFLLHWTSWESIFWINIPFVAASFLLAWRVIPADVRAPVPVKGEKQKSVLRRFFRSGPLLVTNLEFILVNVVYYAFFFGFPSYLQGTRQLDALTVGLLMLIVGVAALVVSPLAGRWIDRVGTRPAMVVSGVLMAAASAGVAFLGPQSPLVLIAGILVLIGCAGGLNNVGLQVALFRATPADLSGLASGLFLTSRYVGTMGAALLLDLAFTHGPSVPGLVFLSGVLVMVVLGYLGLVSAYRRLA